MTAQETDPDLPMSVQESLAEAWVSGGMGQRWPAAGLGALSVAVHTWELLKEAPIVFITSTIIWPQVKYREGTQPRTPIENQIKDLLSMPPPTCHPPSEQDPVSPSVSLSHQEPSISLLSLSIRGKTE